MCMNNNKRKVNFHKRLPNRHQVTSYNSHQQIFEEMFSQEEMFNGEQFTSKASTSVLLPSKAESAAKN